MNNINLIGSGFSHAFSSSGYYKPKNITFDFESDKNDITIYVDRSIINPAINPNKKNYCWLAESSGVLLDVIEWIKLNKTFIEENFIYLFTYDKTLLNLTKNTKYTIPNAVPWIDINDREIHKKTKLVSMIASNKSFTIGHEYRKKIIGKFSNHVDHYGWGYRQMPDVSGKIIALKDYMFSITLESMNYEGCWTEKITDCFVTGTIPIFWGCPELPEFNKDGVIFFNDDFDLSMLSEELYISKMNAIKENFEIANNLPLCEDYFYEKYIKG